MHITHDPNLDFYYMGTTEPYGRIYQDLLASPKRIAVDIETISLADRMPIGISIATDAEHAFYFPLFPEPSPVTPWHLLRDKAVTKIYHNGIFDMYCLREFGIDNTNIMDTAVMSRLQCRPFNDLVSLTYYHQMVVQDAGEMLKGGGWSTMLEMPKEVVAKKCMQDTLATFKLFQVLEPITDFTYMKVEMEIIPILIEMSWRGILIDQGKRLEIEAKLAEEVDWLTGICTEEWGMNPRSSQQVGYVLAKRGAYRVFNKLPFTHAKGRPRTGDTHLSTSKETLEKMDDPVAQLVLTARSKSSFLNSYIIPWGRETRAYTRFHLDAVTGRPSSTERNMQNIPPGNTRGVLIPDTGVFTDADFSQVELRVLAYLSGDREMQYIFSLPKYNPDGSINLDADIHQQTAVALNIIRKIAKNVNFCLPMSTKALTSDGWKTYNQISEDDFILGYDQDMNKMIWAPVLFKYDSKAPVLTFGNQFTKFQSTGAHRWYGRKRVWKSYNRSYYENKVLTTNELLNTKEFNMVLSAPAIMDFYPINQSTITPRDAEVIAWVLSDGERRGRIYQSQTHNPKKVEHINWLLHTVPHHIESVRDDGIITWRLHREYIKPLLDKVDSYGSMELFVLSLSDKSREAFLQGVTLAEGCEQYNTTIIAQNAGDFSNAIKLAGFMDGNFVRTTNPVSYTGKINQKHKLSKPYITTQKFQIFDEQEQPVWCLKTATGNFVVKDSYDQIFITGNAMIYGGSDDTLAETAGIRDRRLGHNLRLSWFNKFRQAGDFIQACQDEASRGGDLIKTLYGRNILLPSVEDRGLSHRLSCSINYRVQGSAAEILKRGLITLKDLDMALTIHDEFLLDGWVDDQLLKDKLEHISEVYTPIEVSYMERWR